MNSSAEAQVLRRGVVPKIPTQAVSPEWLDAQKAKWMAKREAGQFEPFDTFDDATHDSLNTLANLDMARWIKKKRAFELGGRDGNKVAASNHNRSMNDARGRHIAGEELAEMRANFIQYIKTTGTSLRAFSVACGRCQRYVSSIYNGNCSFIYEFTRDNILAAMHDAPNGINPDGSAIGGVQ